MQRDERLRLFIKFPQNHKIIHSSVGPLKNAQTYSDNSKACVLSPTVARSLWDTWAAKETKYIN